MERDVYSYFQQACRRGLIPLRGASGKTVYSNDGNSAVFWIDSNAGRIRSAQYKCTTCVTLMGLCEHLLELCSGLDLRAARILSDEDLIRFHTEIPVWRRDRAGLAIEAFQSAVDIQIKHMQIEGAND